MVYRLRSVSVEYRGPSGPLRVLDDLDLDVGRGECVAVLGPSGTGKSTLLHLLAGLVRPCGGTVELAGRDLARLREPELAGIRCHRIGMVFQSFHLADHLTALENVMLPQWIAGKGCGARTRERAIRLVETVGLAGRMAHRPGRLSGGERQRVAFARALANDPDVVLADEPTGNLDAGATETVIELMRGVLDEGRTVIVATHDPHVASIAHRSFRVEGGLARPGAPRR